VVPLEEVPQREGIARLAGGAVHAEVMPALAFDAGQQLFVLFVFRLRIAEALGHFIEKHGFTLSWGRRAVRNARRSTLAAAQLTRITLLGMRRGGCNTEPVRFDAFLLETEDPVL